MHIITTCCMSLLARSVYTGVPFSIYDLKNTLLKIPDDSAWPSSPESVLFGSQSGLAAGMRRSASTRSLRNMLSPGLPSGKFPAHPKWIPLALCHVSLRHTEQPQHQHREPRHTFREHCVRRPQTGGFGFLPGQHDWRWLWHGVHQRLACAHAAGPGPSHQSSHLGSDPQ